MAKKKAKGNTKSTKTSTSKKVVKKKGLWSKNWFKAGAVVVGGVALMTVLALLIGTDDGSDAAKITGNCAGSSCTVEVKVGESVRAFGYTPGSGKSCRTITANGINRVNSPINMNTDSKIAEVTFKPDGQNGKGGCDVYVKGLRAGQTVRVIFRRYAETAGSGAVKGTVDMTVKVTAASTSGGSTGGTNQGSTGVLRDGTYNFFADHSITRSGTETNYAIDLSNGSKNSGTPIQIWAGAVWTSSVQKITTDNRGSNNMKWAIKYESDGYYTFKNVASGTCMDVSGGSTQPGAKVQGYQCNGTQAQRWKIEALNRYSSDKCFSIRAKGSNRALNIEGGTSVMSNGTRLVIWNSGGIDVNERWCTEPGWG